MPEFLRSFLEALRGIDARSAADIALLTAIIWWLLVLVRGTTAMTLLRGAAIVLIGAFMLARIFDLTVMNWLLRNSITGLLIGVLVIFQPEIRRALERVGRTGLHAIRDRRAYDEVIEVIAEASRDISKRRYGALMVLERETGLEDYIGTGRRLDAATSEELIVGIFYRNSPLHDGAVILRGDRVVAAGCTLPLSDAPLPQHYGTRHRAAVGITESTDAVSIVVSEETGDISVAANGRLAPQRDADALRGTLRALVLAGENGAAAVNGAAQRRSVPP
jgi:diadenylate cyclase